MFDPQPITNGNRWSEIRESLIYRPRPEGLRFYKRQNAILAI
jgi:hypothetical protein